MFRLGRVSDAQLRAIAEEAGAFEPTYTELGATLDGRSPDGYHHDTYERVMGSGSDTFTRATAGLRRWVPHTAAGLRVQPAQPPQLGMTVAIAAPLGPISAVAVCRIVAVIDEPARVGFAYGSLPGHPERGEEAFIVEQTDARVVFRIVAFSRPAEPLARLGGPVTRRIQRRTTNAYLDGLRAFVATCA